MGNILWVASYPKSGNTWVRAFLENYIQNGDRAVDINTMHTISTAESAAHRFQPHLSGDKKTTDLSLEEICALRPLVQADIARQAQGTTFVKTHNYLGTYNEHPLHNSQVTSGSIYVVRNPLDVTVSMANYFDYSIDETIAYMAEEMTGTPNEPENVPQVITSWSKHVSSWTDLAEDAKLIIRYEDLLDDPKKMFRKIESFLGLKKDPKRLKNAIKHSSFAQLKAQEAQRGFVEKHENANRFFRQGQKHQWRQVLSEQQVAQIIEHHGEQMAKFNYLPK
ncbi:sulfotransferase domain-containing protein [Shewanella sp. Isolate11]|uniref:sulfotransferase domain-containing protein n=1 Tax=Shewanella sp. Isolate11 TaxID=2908530 RepID=UPI001EFCE71B|nr:sulfotransferase domain-containing protein [Shewanella sp. Isolate11]MCG9696116.1 sulfotransferase domain-containing protein [Shewanella sp. Isolate11]